MRLSGQKNKSSLSLSHPPGPERLSLSWYAQSTGAQHTVERGRTASEFDGGAAKMPFTRVVLVLLRLRNRNRLCLNFWLPVLLRSLLRLIVGHPPGRHALSTHGGSGCWNVRKPRSRSDRTIVRVTSNAELARCSQR